MRFVQCKIRVKTASVLLGFYTRLEPGVNRSTRLQWLSFARACTDFIAVLHDLKIERSFRTTGGLSE
jgi:hypothetical protein